MRSTSRKTYRLGTIAMALVILGGLSATNAYAATAKKLAFGVQPTNTTAGRVIAAFTVRVLDQQDRLVTDSVAPVTIAIGTNASTGTLYGTATVNAVGGIATFSTLRILPGANGYTFVASSPDLLGATSSAFNITGAGAVCNANGCTVHDPKGEVPTTQNATTATITLPNCPGATTNDDFLSYDESAGNFCAGGCIGSAVFFDSECTTGDPWTIVYRLDRSVLRTNKGAAHVDLYVDNGDGTGTLVPDCLKAGVLDPGPICLSRQYKNGQGDSISEILKLPGDPRLAG